ncbi:hypothetical protein L1887_55502 [Cichorium endivia]|nr:hypothetical protein L1887_55502 [Cichorium endivia]
MGQSQSRAPAFHPSSVGSHNYAAAGEQQAEASQHYPTSASGWVKRPRSRFLGRRGSIASTDFISTPTLQTTLAQRLACRVVCPTREFWRKCKRPSPSGASRRIASVLPRAIRPLLEEPESVKDHTSVDGHAGAPATPPSDHGHTPVPISPSLALALKAGLGSGSLRRRHEGFELDSSDPSFSQTRTSGGSRSGDLGRDVHEGADLWNRSPRRLIPDGWQSQWTDLRDRPSDEMLPNARGPADPSQTSRFSFGSSDRPRAAARRAAATRHDAHPRFTPRRSTPPPASATPPRRAAIRSSPARGSRCSDRLGRASGRMRATRSRPTRDCKCPSSAARLVSSEHGEGQAARVCGAIAPKVEHQPAFGCSGFVRLRPLLVARPCGSAACKRHFRAAR